MKFGYKVIPRIDENHDAQGSRRMGSAQLKDLLSPYWFSFSL